MQSFRPKTCHDRSCRRGSRAEDVDCGHELDYRADRPAMICGARAGRMSVMKNSIDPSTGDLLCGGKRVVSDRPSDPPPPATTAPDSGCRPGPRSPGPGCGSCGTTRSGDRPGSRSNISVGQELERRRRRAAALAGARRGRRRSIPATAARPDRRRVQGPSRPRSLEGRRRARARSRARAGCVAVYEHVRKIDPDHPLVIIEAPRGPGPTPGSPSTKLTAGAVRPYSAACDVARRRIYPVSIPPGAHAGRAPVNTDISVVGDVTTSSLARRRRRRSGRRCRSPGAASSRLIPSSSRRCSRRGSWPTTRLSPELEGCSSSAASSSR